MAKKMEEKYAVIMNKISFSYRKEEEFIKNLSLKLKESKYYCIVGHNGSGKSTFSKLLTGLIKPDSGSIYIFDQLLSKANYQKIFSSLGVVFQNPDSQFITSSIEEELAFGLENKKVPTQFMKKIVEALIEALELGGLKNLSPTAISGGEKQKVAIASVLALNPTIFFFDESSSMLSPAEKVEILKLMKRLVTDYKKTVISITHDMEELLNADEIIVFHKGKIVAHIKDRSELLKLPLSFFSDLSLLPPFFLHLKNLLREDYSLELSDSLSEEEFIQKLALLASTKS